MSSNLYEPPHEPSPKQSRRTATPRIVCAVFVLASVSLFVASLMQDCFYIARPNNPRAWASGAGLLFIGWILVPSVPAWLANPTVVASWILIWFRKAEYVAIGCSVLSLVLSLSFLGYREILTDTAGNKTAITGYGPGYWLWVGSCAVATVGSLAAQRIK